MHNSVNAPLYPIFQDSIWELAAVHQVLVALDELQFCRQQSVLLSGEALHRAQFQLQKAERDLSTAKAVLLKVLNELTHQNGRAALETLRDLEASWESNLIRPTTAPTPHPHPTP